MAATTSQKARLLDLVTGVLELVRDGKRDLEEVANVLQFVKDTPSFTTSFTRRAVPSFLRDMREEGWEIVENIDEEPVSASGLELVSFLKQGESSISGEEIRKRAQKAGASLGQRQAEYLFEHQAEIPSEWRDFYLVFPGTVWRDRLGYLHVPNLHWHGTGWDLDFHWLEYDWYSRGRLVRRK